MRLFHGTDKRIEHPDCQAGRDNLDFGKGFYTTSDFQQASKWARRTANRLKQSQAYVSVYEVPEEKLLALRVLRFDKPDQQWLHFVAANRKGAAPANEWDIICGPVANDQTMPVIDLFLDGMYDEEETIRRLLPQKLKDQYTFKSDSAIALLRFKEVISV